MRNPRISLVVGTLLVVSCEGWSPAASSKVSTDTVGVLRATLTHVLQADSTLLLETRLLPADSSDVMSPYSGQHHAGVKPSDLIVRASRGLRGVRLYYPGQAMPDSGTIVSLSRATINDDHTFIFVVWSSFNPRWGYSAHFRRLRLEHNSGGGWQVVSSVFAGQEN